MELSTGFYLYIAVIVFIAGTVFGSFLNCLAWRTAHGQSVLRGRSHCAVCNHVLGPADLVPVVSYLALRGRCRYCRQKISPRYMVTEIVSGSAFVVSFIRYGLSLRALQLIILFCILLPLSLVDLETLEIPDRFHIAGIILWVCTGWMGTVFPGRGMGTYAWAAGEDWPALTPGVILRYYADGLAGGILISVFMLLAVLLFDRILKKESMGGGDIKLYFTVSLFLGTWCGFFNVILSCLTGLVFAFALKAGKIPFGPSICAAAFISMLAGGGFVNWYLSLL